jgi:hypothetical protein
MDYLLRPQDEALIRAALDLGDWILAQRETTRAQRRAVTALQEALRELPAAPRPIVAEYGFEVRWDPPDGKGGLYRAWRVSLSPAGLEIFSVYSPDEKIEYEDKLSHELNFWLRPARESRHDGYNCDLWMEEVRDPARFRGNGALFGVVAELEKYRP